jgi:hypothetical protein
MASWPILPARLRSSPQPTHAAAHEAPAVRPNCSFAFASRGPAARSADAHAILAPRPQLGPGPGFCHPAWAECRPDRSEPLVFIRRPGVKIAGSKSHSSSPPETLAVHFLLPFPFFSLAALSGYSSGGGHGGRPAPVRRSVAGSASVGSPSLSFLFLLPISLSTKRIGVQDDRHARQLEEKGGAAAGPLARARAPRRVSAAPASGLVSAPWSRVSVSAPVSSRLRTFPRAGGAAARCATRATARPRRC